MNSNSNPQLADVVETTIGNRYLLLKPETGAWVLLGQAARDLAYALDGKDSVGDFVHQHGSTLTYDAVAHVIRELDAVGLLTDSPGPLATTAPSTVPSVGILELTGACNLACSYCYAEAESSAPAPRMSRQTAERVIDDLAQCAAVAGQDIRVIFHGGEPLLRFALIEDLVTHYSERYPDQLKFEVQTNGTLITDHHARFFKQFGVNVGISIDGPPAVHDRTRFDHKGRGSHARIRTAVEYLHRHEVSFGAIVVLSAKNHRSIDAIFDHLLSLGVRAFAFNSLFCDGRATGQSNLTVSGSDRFAAFTRLARLLIDHNRSVDDASDRVEERNLRYLAQNVVQRDGAYMCMRSPCGAGTDAIAFRHDGDVYPCDAYFGDTRYRLGNVHQSTLSKMLTGNPVVQRLRSAHHHSLPECTACDWRNLCQGICASALPDVAGLSQPQHPECNYRRRMIPQMIEWMATGALRFEDLQRRAENRPPRHFYFNINYRCNSRCIFCASDLNLETPDSPDLDARSFKEILQVNSVQANDSVTINGGEPTVSQHLLSILKSITNRGANSHLFTNGRTLANNRYCARLIKTGVSKISIPMFGRDAEAHDRMTAVRGSFKQTVKGIHNLLELRAPASHRPALELKLLFCAPTAASNPDLLQWLLETFPQTDVVSLNALIVSRAVTHKADQLVVPAGALRASINAVLDRARELHLESRVVINDVPLCLLESRNRGYLSGDASELPSAGFAYYDPNYRTGRAENEDIRLTPTRCRSCSLLAGCRFINRHYFDEIVAEQSIRVVFPDEELLRDSRVEFSCR